jgi:tRNA A58 N-methylase Trm61
MTSIMANRVGKNGRVYSFEPHPEIYQELSLSK